MTKTTPIDLENPSPKPSDTTADAQEDSNRARTADTNPTSDEHAPSTLETSRHSDEATASNGNPSEPSEEISPPPRPQHADVHESEEQHVTTTSLDAKENSFRRESLKISMQDVQILISYASREGISLTENLVQDIFNAINTIASGQWDSRTETVFWTRYRELAEKLKPVTVDSIKSTTIFGGKLADEPTIASARNTGNLYRASTISVLIIIILLQIYWFWGNSLATEIVELRPLLDQTLAEIRDVETSLQIAHENLFNLNNALYESTQNPASDQNKDALQKEINKANLEVSRYQAKYDAAFDKFDSLITKLQTDFQLLQKWDVISDLMIDTDTINPDIFGRRESAFGPMPVPAGAYADLIDDDEQALSADERQQRLQQQKEFEQRQKEYELQQKEYKKQHDNLRRQLINFEASLRASKSVLETLNAYLLPLLYGLLGALAFILRTLTSEIREVTFSRASSIRYTLRWPLGMLAGITVGFFFKPDEITPISTIQPLALAFLAGYSVELLFTGLDKIVFAFTQGGEKRTKPAAE